VTLMTIALALPAQADAQDHRERTIVRLSESSARATLSIRIFWGSVTVRASERADIVVETLGRSTPVVDTARNVVSITGRAGEVTDLVVDVPIRTDVRIAKTGPNKVRNASSAGPIVVYGVDGAIEIDTIGGAVSLADVSGSVVAHSRTGGVTARLLRPAPGRPMAFTSYGGDVEVTLPRTIKAEVLAHSDRGRIVSDFDLGRGRPARGTLNGGGPEIELRSFAGNVFLRKGN
jgi:hypothetical protein